MCLRLRAAEAQGARRMASFVIGSLGHYAALSFIVIGRRGIADCGFDELRSRKGTNAG